MPKKPTSLKESSLRNPIGVPIETKKKKLLKESLKEPIGKNKKTPIEAKETAYEQAVAVFGKIFVDAEKKSGFELYKLLRDSVIDTISHSEHGVIFKEGSKHNPATCLYKMDMLEKEYLENFFVSMTIKQGSPDMYPVLTPIIDKYIKPTKQRQGASLFKETIAGLFVFLLSGESAGSIRQANNIASQLFNLNMTYLERSYKNIKGLSLNKEQIIDQDITALLAVFGTIKYFEARFNKISAIQNGNTRSENEFKKSLQSLEDLSQLIINNNLASIKKFLKKFPNSYLEKFIVEEKFDLNTPLPTIMNVLHVLGMVYFIEFLPNLASQKA